MKESAWRIQRLRHRRRAAPRPCLRQRRLPRPRDRTQGTFGRVIPKANFNFGKSGWGAWEVAGRYSFVDLNSGEIEGGRLSMFMAGVNWYLRPHVKWRFDYGFGQVTGREPGGHLNIFQTRVELDF